MPGLRTTALVAEILLWSLVLPVLKRVVPLRRLIAFLATSGKERDEGAWPAIGRWSSTFTRLRPSLRSNCLERSLLAYRFLGHAGASPHLVVAVAQDGSRLIGHAWVTVDGEPLHESRSAVDRFTTLIEFDSRGRAVEEPGDTRIPDRWR